MRASDDKALQYAIAEITEIATGFGLDFYPMRYEICPAEIIYTFGAYGMPTRFSHWSFGKQFFRMKLQYDLGLSKIYELVINSDPCYAFLLDTNSLIQNKLIVAHVLAHCDFFKNNIRFSNTKRDMVESMSATAERVKAYEHKYGKEEVETFLDAVLAIQEHIDPSLMRPKLAWSIDDLEEEEVEKKKASQYDDLWNLDNRNKKQERSNVRKKKKIPPQPEKDLLLFIEEYSRELEDWQRDILTMMREEMLYFWPQLETKIMNEGWASFWHQRILREMDLTSDEAIEFAKLNAGVVQPSKTSINPYYLGIKMFEDIEERYNNPTEEMKRRGVKPGSGRDKIFEVREIEWDVSFLRNYLNKDLVMREDMYLFQRQGKEYKVIDKEWEHVRDQLVNMRTNGGFPYLVVEDGDYLKNGELYIKHSYEGIELDLKYLEKVLPYLHQLWGRTVHMESIVESKGVVFSYDGKMVHRKYV
ncbi:TPA: stage V sporulation protein SpoVR [Bacillus cereus]|jgi:stage V sporulation protein R|uniref:Stage V sporulation protein R n=15 Tax=Bacillus cereus group TaxID=86661 RepID=A0A0J1I3K7_BACAN|nr:MULTISPECIES: stage V sporulation protein SpoVR [Bacillus]ACM11288.1 stage V sporulation protein R [Bacillus cereus Q1]ADY20070.1 stage V sporulation protein R [Bacillus thuringiensis serovar finitimus YBT-020]EDX54758.1 stage V sporulation protein R [Bacillus cereus W]EDX70102.1 stage V sporulation protein R [Bacillus cereus NVH0597-99]EEL47159.1 Stage V sporulation protein R [Bacillus cereus Rock3-42]EEM24158.1 Stage V sporulation protein R [Bacillus thuringiensis serovar tochigiensis BG